MAHFTKPNNNRTFYLSTKKAIKYEDINSATTWKYTWNISPITINQNASLQLLNISSKHNEKPNNVYVVKITDISSIGNEDTIQGSGEVLYVGLIDNKVFNKPPYITLTSQTISQISLTICDDIDTFDGDYITNNFVICLEIKEFEPQIIHSSSSSVNKNYTF